MSELTARRSKSVPGTILVVSGVNLDLLGRREPEIYGTTTLDEIYRDVRREAKELGLRVECRQTNSESELLTWLSDGPGKGRQRNKVAWRGVVINPGAWTHTSLALADRLKGLALPFVEVHLSDITRREEFRRHSFLTPHALKVISGHGPQSYVLGLQALKTFLH